MPVHGTEAATEFKNDGGSLDTYIAHRPRLDNRMLVGNRLVAEVWEEDGGIRTRASIRQAARKPLRRTGWDGVEAFN